MSKKRWLEKFSWDIVSEMNRQACISGKTQHEPRYETYDKTRSFWEEKRIAEQTFREAVEVCRQCHQLAPFAFFNGNTFAGIARTLSQEASNGVGPTKAFMLRSAVGHYVAGVMDAKEFDEIFSKVTSSPAKENDKK